VAGFYELVHSMKMAVFWVVAPCRLVKVYQRFGSQYCLHHQGDGVEKTAYLSLSVCERDDRP
jgi:hypothetical protein